MSVSLATDRTIVARLRIRRGATDPMLARLRAATLLSSASLQASGLSPAAILVVRRLSDPMPGRLGLRGASQRLPHEWERAVCARMDAIARAARRPAREAAADAADAVLFADFAELLACLARDWMRGALQRWWWETLFPQHDAATAAARAWLERPECVPAAMAHLAAAGEELGFVSRLGHQGARQLLQSVLAAHALPELGVALAPLDEPRIEAPDRVDEPMRGRQEARALEGGARLPPPWRGGATHAAAGESIDAVAEALVGVCHTLQQAPHLARSREFIARVKQWATGQAPVSVPLSRIRALAGMAAATMHFRGNPGGGPERHTEPGGQTLPARGTGKMPVEPPSVVGSAPAASPRKERPEAPRAASYQVQTPSAPQPEAARPCLDELRVDTQFGGVLFLVNLALFLGLYGDFTKPARRGLSLSMWDFVALVGERLAGPLLRDDPVWALLARLANRHQGEEPGGAFSPRRHLALQRWLARLLPRLRRRLEEALGPDAAAVLPCLPARVWMTPTRVDATFRLVELPVEVRLSGLDRDPGWVPSAGRSVHFHFD